MRREPTRPALGVGKPASGPSAPPASTDPPPTTTSTVLRVRKREEVYRDILLRFFVLMKTAQLQSSEDPEFRDALSGFLDPLTDCLESEGTLVVGERDGYLYLNGVRARIDVNCFPAQKYLVQTLVASEVSGILFEKGVGAAEICTFLDGFFPAGRPVGPEMLADVIRQDAVPHIHALKRSEMDPIWEGEHETLDGVAPSPSMRRRGQYFSKRTYFKSIFVLKHLLDGVTQSCCLDLREAKQIIQDLVEHVLEDENASIALDLIRSWDRELFRHSVNAAVISVAIGRRIGLTRLLLGDVGVAALLHDAGKGDAEPAEVDALAGHSRMASFRRLVMQGARSQMMLRAATVAFEQHRANGAQPASLMARIVRVASRFETLVSLGGTTERSVRLALEKMRRDAALDADLVEVLETVIEEEGVIP